MRDYEEMRDNDKITWLFYTHTNIIDQSESSISGESVYSDHILVSSIAGSDAEVSPVWGSNSRQWIIWQVGHDVTGV